MMHFIESFIDLVWSHRKYWRKDSTDALQRKRSRAPIFANSVDAVVSTRRNQRQPSAAATDSHDATRLHDFIQPALPHFASRLWRAFNQARAGARQPLKSPDGRCRQTRR